MKGVLSTSKIYTFLLLLLPSLILISWINVYAGNASLQLTNYLLTHILPAAGISVIFALIIASSLHEGYELNYKRVLFTFSALVGSLFLFSYAMTFFGFQSQFVTATVPSVVEYDKQQVLGINTEQTDPRETASKFYSAEFAMVLVLLVVFYSIASVLFKTKKKTTGKRLGTTKKKAVVANIGKKTKVEKKAVKKKKHVKKKTKTANSSSRT